MIEFGDYYSRESIIATLCKIRVKYAKNRHKLHLIRDITTHPKTNKISEPNKNIPRELSDLLPPRRSWVHLGSSNRYMYKNPLETNSLSIQKTIKLTEKKINTGEPVPDWYNRLNNFIRELQEQLDGTRPVEISKPIIKPIRKDKGKPECRPICIYDLKSRILIGLAAKYFTDLFDPYFHDCSYAFRSRIGECNHYTHHEAIDEINRFRLKNINRSIFVSECDIKKFFDSIDHSIIHTVYAKLKEKISEDENQINPVAEKIFTRYLETFSFNNDVFSLNGTTYFDEYNIAGGYFGWIDKDIKFKEYYDILENEFIGIPQGGALSCLIANMVMNEIDDKIIGEHIELDNDLLYLRFCDDMVLMHTDKEKCNEILLKYLNGLAELKLIGHDPVKIPQYGKGFWKDEKDKDRKSKTTYKWGSTIADIGNVPWVAFVGYQIRYDGSIRIRKSSFKKEIQKQKEEVNKVLEALDYNKSKSDILKNSRKSRQQQLYAIKCRLISMAVGKQNLFNYKKYSPNFCWIAGFNSLNDNPVSRSQLKTLDRMREKQLIIFNRKISSIKKETHKADVSKPIENFHGFPYSYFSFFKK